MNVCAFVLSDVKDDEYGAVPKPASFGGGSFTATEERGSSPRPPR